MTIEPQKDYCGVTMGQNVAETQVRLVLRARVFYAVEDPNTHPRHAASKFWFKTK